MAAELFGKKVDRDFSKFNHHSKNPMVSLYKEIITMNLQYEICLGKIKIWEYI